MVEIWIPSIRLHSLEYMVRTSKLIKNGNSESSTVNQVDPDMINLSMKWFNLNVPGARASQNTWPIALFGCCDIKYIFACPEIAAYFIQKLSWKSYFNQYIINNWKIWRKWDVTLQPIKPALDMHAMFPMISCGWWPWSLLC